MAQCRGDLGNPGKQKKDGDEAKIYVVT